MSDRAGEVWTNVASARARTAAAGQRPGGSSASGQLVAALADPETYPDRPASVEVRESHISWVFLAGDRAYKLKKPLVLAFLDYGTAARRRTMCRLEVRLNRTLASDIYLGVRGVAETNGGFELTADDDPRAVDFLVEMRRYDETRTLAARLDRGELDREQVNEVARVLARFHAHAPRVAVGDRAALATERRFEENLHELFASLQQRGEIDRVLALERFAHAFIVHHTDTMEARRREGRVREVHGDLRAEHVLVDGEVRIVDCIEFDRGLRQLDVGDDLAFLVFDLARLGGERFGQQLVEDYRDAGGEPGDDALIAFYAAYRALVRSKVALTRASQHPATSSEHGHHSAQARDLIAIAEGFAWRARLPLVIVLCGLPASGKSHFASALAQASRLQHLSSDVTRKRLAGMRPTERATSAIYSADFNRLTYTDLGRRAAGAVATRGGALVDATFRHRADRDAFADAFGDAAPLLFVECRAPARVLAKRAAERDHEPGGVSDASLAVVLRESSTWDPLDEVPPEAHLTLRSDRPVEAQLADLLAVLDRRLRQL